MHVHSELSLWMLGRAWPCSLDLSRARGLRHWCHLQAAVYGGGPQGNGLALEALNAQLKDLSAALVKVCSGAGSWQAGGHRHDLSGDGFPARRAGSWQQSCDGMCPLHHLSPHAPAAAFRGPDRQRRKQCLAGTGVVNGQLPSPPSVHRLWLGERWSAAGTKSVAPIVSSGLHQPSALPPGWVFRTCTLHPRCLPLECPPLLDTLPALQRYQLLPEYAQSLKAVFGTAAQPLTSAEAVNGWVSEATHGKIQSIVDQQAVARVGCPRRCPRLAANGAGGLGCVLGGGCMQLLPGTLGMRSCPVPWSAPRAGGQRSRLERMMPWAACRHVPGPPSLLIMPGVPASPALQATLILINAIYFKGLWLHQFKT